MGIEGFFKFLSKASFTTKDLDKKIKCKQLYIDFNSILYCVTADIENDIRYIQYSKIINKIDDRCRELMKLIDPENICDIESNIPIEDWLLNFKNHIKVIMDDKYMFDAIRNYVDNIMQNILTHNDVERIYIAIDGIPTFAKMVEQKKRRSLKYITNEFKHKIKMDHIESFNAEDRKIFEKHIFYFEKSKIKYTSSFMDRLDIYILSSDFQDWFKTKYHNLKEIILSPHTIPGEGEKKIINDMNIDNYHNVISGKETIIYSPDSDIVIMSIMICNILNRRATLDLVSNEINKKRKYTKTEKKCNVGLIRYNRYDDNYDYIISNDICNDLYTYVQKNTLLNLDEDRVTNDLGFIFTILGNDFIPKLEAINIKTNIDVILDVYLKTIEYAHISRHYGMYMIYQVNDRHLDRPKTYKINYATFIKFFEILSYQEIALMKEKYISNKYKNYKYLKKLFTKDKLLYPQIVKYIQFANIIYSVRIHRSLAIPHEEISKLFSSDIVIYIELFVNIEKLRIKYDDIKGLSVHMQISALIMEVMDNIFIQPSLYLIPDTIDIKSGYYQANIAKNLPHPDMKITPYDEEIYMMRRCIGKYESKYMNEIGFFSLTTKNRYFYISSNVIIDSEEYYKKYFGININKDIDKLNNIVAEYIKGLFWVFNYYMNVESSSQTWHYPYSHPPLMYHIIKYINNKIFRNKKVYFSPIDDLYNSVNKPSIEQTINPIEYYLYITPFERLDPEIIGEKLYEDMKKIKYDALSPSLDIIDTRYTYMSKAKLISHWIIGFNEWRKTVKNIII